MTQKDLIIEYCKRNGKIIPAKLKESERSVAGGWLGSETIRRCQEMVEEGKLYRWPNEGRFAVYSIVAPPKEELKPFKELTPFVKNFLATNWNPTEPIKQPNTLW